VLPKVLGRSAAVGTILQSEGTTVTLDGLEAVAGQWPTPGMDTDRYAYIVAVGSDSSLMSRMRRIKNAETVYTGPRKTGGSNWSCEPEALYAAFNEILADRE